MGNSSSSQSRKQEKYRHGPTVHQSRSFPNYSDDNSFLAPHTQGHQALSASPPPHIGSSHFAPPPYAALDDSTLGLGHTPPDKPLETESEYAFPSPSPRAQNLRTPMRAGTMEDALETLRKFNTIFIVDDSASMLTENRWGQARAALSGLANLAGQYDNDGIDIYFLNSSQVGRDLRDARQVVNLFNQIRIQPFAATPIGDKLEELLQEYMNKIESVAKNLPALRKIKPVNYIVLTDGSPSDDPESVIIQTARRLDTGHFPISQVGIQFVQVGNDQSATAYLNELDDGLSGKHGIRDIVDTTKYSDIGGSLNSDILIKILLGGINRRVDKAGARALR